ncbi:Outer membrane protein beta-barrel domain-containing protein [Mariniphaga anaerophila]|uniref:Outer membrane protein beta-barrel domain-containing protein n=1 Tax=Mariniphaga anaerophila TaxID=1484053 RepID=A0A1M4TLF1_9BACT|nr:outer membrane beta-barrel protein [Mariniphaga anaerophila]SHE45290.1 Outer membrane protein beta-barrel domain-containing protein [Mariniphaga anaerophila]
MKKIFLSLIIVTSLISLSVTAQEGEKSRLSFGFNAGVGQNHNAYRMNPETYARYNHEYYEGDLHFTTGINVGYFITKRLRPRFEFRYNEFKYGMTWDEDYPQFERTETKLYTLNFNLQFDFMMLNTDRFQLFISPGLVGEFVKDRLNRNYLTDGSNNIYNYTAVTQQYSEEIGGLNLSLIAKYKFTDNLGMTVTPGYNFYLKKWLPGNDKNYTRSLFNVGVEYTLPF